MKKLRNCPGIQNFPGLEKLFRIMRFTAFLILISSISVFANKTYSQSKMLNLNVKNSTIKEVLSQIEDQSEFSFMYSGSVVDVSKKVSVNAQNEKIDDILKSLFANTNINYKVEDRIIVLTHAESTKSIDQPNQQQRSISGKVTDVHGEPLPGVTVVVKGTTMGTISDFDGNYTISNIPSDGVLSFSFVGMISQEISFQNQTTINVVMEEETIGLDEVVAVGYGVQKKSNITGAISSVKSEDLANRSSQSVGQALQGKVAGVQLVQTSGQPGEETSIRVRGFSSIGSSDPLYIVDGLKVSSIGYLDVNNIESIEILKDGASAAIYGAEAGNGVVLITTKSGSKGEGKFYYYGNYSSSSVDVRADLLNAEEYINFLTEGGFFDQEYFDNNYDGVTDTDWADVMFDKGFKQSHTVGFEGGSDRGNYHVSLSYNDADGTLIGGKDTYQRISSQINGGYQITDYLKVGTTTNISRYKQKAYNDSSAERTSITGAVSYYDPLTPVVYESESDIPDVVNNAINAGYNVLHNSGGKYFGVSPYMILRTWNPMAMLDFQDSNSDGMNINGTVYGELAPVEGLVITSRLGYRIGTGNSYTYEKPYWANGQYASTAPSLSVGQNNSFYYQWENFANYNITVGKNDFTAMAGMSYIESTYKSQSVTTDALESLDENFRYLDYSTSGANDDISGATNENTQIAYYGRLGWSYDEKYNVQVNFRADAYDSSKLAITNSWGYFPSVSAGWTISNEQFLKDMDSDILSYLKLRGSYGINGNISNLSGYQYASSMLTGNNYSMNDIQLLVGLHPSTFLQNNELEWETSKQVDLGIDMRLFDDKLTFATDFYSKNTSGMLINTTPSLISGTSSMYRNVGIIHNHGFEFDLGWKDNIGALNYSINGNLATVTNNVKEYLGEGTRIAGSGPSFGTITYFEEGLPLWYMRGYEVTGIDPENGDAIYNDRTPDGVIDDNDKTLIGSGIPDFTYGITLSLDYKNFDFSIYGTGSYGSEIFYSLSNQYSAAVNRNKFLYDDRWTTTNINASRPKPTMDDKYFLSDAMVFSGDFFRVKQIQLGYNLSKSLLKNMPVSTARIYVSLENWVTFSSYPGMDPETRFSTSQGLGLDMGSTPIPREALIGVNVSF